MTAADLRAWIVNLGDDDPIRVAFGEERDGDCAALLNARTQPGAVHARPLAVVVSDRTLYGRLDLIRRHLRFPDGSAVEFPAHAAVHSLACAVLYVLEQPGLNLRIPVATLDAGASALVALGLISTDDRTALLAAAAPLSLIQEAFGIDTPDVTGVDVANARKAGE